MINSPRAALAMAAVIACWHGLWSVLVASGEAQSVLDFVFWLHFLQPAYVVEPFDLMRSVRLILFTAMFAGALAYAVSVTWNGLQRRRVFQL